MKKAIIISLALLLSVSYTLGQSTYEKLKREQEARFKKEQAEQKKRIERNIRNQDAMIELKVDNQKKRIWLKQSLQSGTPQPKIDEPDNPRTFDPDNDERIQFDRIITTPESDEPFESILEDSESEVDNDAFEEIIPQINEEVRVEISGLEAQFDVDYFGDALSVNYDPNMFFKMDRVSENRIEEQVRRLEASRYMPLLSQIKQKQAEYSLNDWGFCHLINTAAKEMYPYDKNAQTVFNWFMLSKAGYIATVCYEDNQVFLLAPCKQTLYGKTFLRSNQYGKMYALDLNGGNPEIRSAKVYYDEDESGMTRGRGNRVLDLKMTKAPNFAPRNKKRLLTFAYEGQNYELPIEVNVNTIEFFKTYPFVDLDIYMGTPLSSPAQRTLVASLREMVQDLQPMRNRRTVEEEQVNFLLRFVQTAFPYQTDAMQFGGEKYLFADEVLFYKYSDCEDRSVLFSWLVREIVGLDVVGVLYPGHAATAVSFNRKVPGDYITYRGKTYTICDPTYINANYGMLLPDVRGQIAKVVDHR
ncbi:MAG: hypothetical protein AAFW00_01540 [Bacteroidota bacterium]